jgi:soluble lytic murein transglycosylase-like protein
MASLDQSTLDYLQNTLWTSLENGYGLPTGILNAIARWETRGAYDNKGFNPATQAAGLFQLRPNAIQQVKISYGIDLDPMNVYQASLAAALIFKRYNRMYQGALTLMVMAYNWGEGNVRKLINKLANDQVASVPLETRNYVANTIPFIG